MHVRWVMFIKLPNNLSFTICTIITFKPSFSLFYFGSWLLFARPLWSPEMGVDTYIATIQHFSLHLYYKDPMIFFNYIATIQHFCLHLYCNALLLPPRWPPPWFPNMAPRPPPFIKSFIEQFYNEGQPLVMYSLKNSTTKSILFTRWSKLLPIITLVRSKVKTQHLALEPNYCLFPSSDQKLASGD